MTAPVAPRVRALSIHAGYRCQHTGVCCSSGWDIPVEPEMHLRNALGSGRLRIPEATIASTLPGALTGHGASCFRRVSGLPHGARVVFATDSSGRCIFLDADRHCAIHRQLGPDALASACRDFPRIVTLTPLGVSITLSHYCPTAAGMLFAPVTPRDPRQPGPEGTSLSILENPPGFLPTWPYEGLDARDALPPLLRPGVLMDWPSLERWETFAVSLLGDEARTPQAALDVLAAAAEEARSWTPGEGTFEEYFQRALSSRGTPLRSGSRRSPERGRSPGTRRGSAGASVSVGGSFGTGHTDVPQDDGATRSAALAWDLVARCVPHHALLPPAPEGLEDADARWVASSWPSLSRPVRRWLAAKAFASWLALQGEGLRTTVLGLRVALEVLRAEAARGCAEAGRTLDAALLEQAVRRADLLLVHLADPLTLASRLSRCETDGSPAARVIASLPTPQ